MFELWYEQALFTAELAFAFARYSDTASTFDSQIYSLSGTNFPIRRNEAVLEATYLAQIAPWRQGAAIGAIYPHPPGKQLGDAGVLILRTNITF
ncbi:MAG: hypothetical protein JOZ05_18465 [Acetobacteraceae bacterium]|nr:hypothetical protein [Acetobacteraceae bacterium]